MHGGENAASGTRLTHDSACFLGGDRAAAGPLQALGELPWR